MNPIERKEMIGIVGEALEQIVLPRLDSIEDKLKEHDLHFEKIEEHFNTIDNKLNEHDQQFSDIGDQLERMERKLDATITVTDRHDQAIAQIQRKIA